MEADFSGYATKAGLRCSDGRTITAEAFKNMNGTKVPLVWQHVHNEPTNVLGHALLESREDGVYTYGFFNDTPAGKNAKALVQHGDITMLSIYANQLVEKSKTVLHGIIREVSLVLSGANPGALIDNVAIRHADGDIDELDDAAIIYTGLPLTHSSDDQETEEDTDSENVEDVETVENVDTNDDALTHEDKTIRDVIDTLNEEQKNVLHYLIANALENATGSAEHSAITGNDEGDLDNKEGTDGTMRHNVFEQNGTTATDDSHSLSHADIKAIVENGVKLGSLRDAVNQYALQHGIDNIDVLFPDAKNITSTPEFNKRRTEWVASVLNGTRHTPWSRIKTISADLTQEEARAKGYVKGTYKKEEWFGVTKRTTTPTTVYKKQKLDRDDVLDITDFDIVTWLKAEMRIMLEEEFARAVLIGDGRDVAHEDKIKDPAGAADGAGIRSILNDHELYVTTLYANVSDANSNYEEVVDVVMDGMEFYKGTGTPVFYTTIKHLNMFKKAKNANGDRYYKTNAEVAEALGVSRIETVEPMNEVPDVIGIIVNLQDYNIGADKGGEVSLFDDFDIDYNQLKYLMETRISGALIKIKSALVIRKTAAGNVLVDPVTDPTYNAATYVVTIPTQTGVIYKNADTNATLTAGAQTALTAGQTLNVTAVADTGYYFKDNANDWKFFRRS